MPGFKRTTVKCPFASVTVVAVAFVALFFVVTVAPGTTDLVWSVTVPPMAPSVVDCENPARGAANTSQKCESQSNPARRSQFPLRIHWRAPDDVHNLRRPF